MNLSPRLAVFDVDGTLVDSQHHIVTTMQLSAQLQGLTPPSPAAIRRIIGLSLNEAVARLFPAQTEREWQAVVTHYKEGFAELRRQPETMMPLFPGMRDLLLTLGSSGWRLAVATGNSKRGLQSILDFHGLAGMFVSLQTADDNPGKPHPAMLSRAIAEAGCSADRAAMIGDTSYDMQMGRELGTARIGVAWGYHSTEELLQAGAQLVVENSLALLEALEPVGRSRS